MTETISKILCNKCKVELQGIADTDPQRYGCPVCGASDTRDEVMREAGEYTKEIIARDLQNKARDVAAEVRFIQFSGEPIPHGAYRFITDFQP